MEKRAAQQAAKAAATGNANVGGMAVNTGGMVQPPAGAPEAVNQMIAAGNAIATLPYIYGGGHASFHADGYDCSGSVSYALAAAGLVSSPMVSGDFEDWGDAGSRQVGDDLRQRRPRLDGGRRLAVRHRGSGRERDPVGAGRGRVLRHRGVPPARPVAGRTRAAPPRAGRQQRGHAGARPGGPVAARRRGRLSVRDRRHRLPGAQARPAPIAQARPVPGRAPRA